MLDRIKAWARHLKRDSHAIYLASRDPRVPWYAKALAIAVAAYALSPIDLIPDFIPVIGYLDDLLLLPGLIWLALRLLPAVVRERCRLQARDWLASAPARPAGRIAAAVIVALWGVAALLAWRWWAGR